MVESDSFPESVDPLLTIRDGLRCVEDSEDPVGRHQALLHQRVLLGDRLGRLQHPPLEHDIDDELRPGHAQIPVEIEPAAIEEDGGRDADPQEF